MRVVKLNQIWSQNRWTLMRPQENNWKKHPVKSEDLWWGRRKIIEKNTLWNLRIRGCAVVWTKKSLMRCTSNLFRETVLLWDCSGEERFLSVLSCERADHRSWSGSEAGFFVWWSDVGIKVVTQQGFQAACLISSSGTAPWLRIWSITVEQLPDCTFDQWLWHSFLVACFINYSGTVS